MTRTDYGHSDQAFTKRKEPGQTVYIVGAGASAAEGAPTNNSLLTAILDQVSGDDRGLNLSDFVRNVYHRKRLRENVPSFEELLTFVESAITEERYFSRLSREQLLGLRTKLLLAAGEALAKDAEPIAEFHDLFVKNLFAIKGVSHLNVSFINFNYDLNLDRVLIHNRRIVKDLEYGCYLRSFDITYKDRRKRFDPARKGMELFLLKPHGSFSWTWCPRCGFLVAFPKHEIALDILRGVSVTCVRCHTQLESLIVPPAWTKTYRNPNIVRILTIAEFLLAQAKTVVFVGYSLGDADFQFRSLLLRAFSMKKRWPHIVVVSKEGDDEAETKRRYLRLFGDVKWINGGFENFAKHPIHHNNRKEIAN